MSTQYADVAFLAVRAAGLLLEDVSTNDQNATLVTASETADSYLASRYTLPLVTWTDALRRVTVDIAAWDICGGKAVGSDGTPTLWRVRYLDAIRWLEDVAARKINPPGIVDSSSPPATGSVTIGSNCPRGW